MFVHLNWAHLYSNMVGLHIWGFQAISGHQSLFGKAMPWFLFALLYFGFGLCGCLAEYTVFNRRELSQRPREAVVRIFRVVKLVLHCRFVFVLLGVQVPRRRRRLRRPIC